MASAVGSARQRFAILGFAIALVAGPQLAGQAATPPALKAAFLLNFMRFAEWPAPAVKGGALVLCVADEQRLLEALTDTVKGQTVAGRSLDVRSVGSPREAETCQLLYLGAWDEVRTRGAVDALKGIPVLTVSDRDDFAGSGGVIQLFIEKDRMRFAINIDAAKERGVKLSAQLLNLAKIVRHGDAR